MILDKHYPHILSELEKGHRALVRYSGDELGELEKLLRETTDPQILERVLCLVEHSAALHGNFETELVRILKPESPDHLIIFALNAARRHVIQARFTKGQRLHFDFLDALMKLLHSKSPEVVEWTLRTIEECGPQGVFFLREFDKIKPPPWKWFNPHQRAVREIITLLERRWSRFEKPQS